MTTFEAHTEITAPTAQVWERLVDLAAWPAWDTTLERVEGAAVAGGRVTIHVAGTSRAFRLRVVELEPGSRMVLRGGMPLGLFTGTRRYRLAPLAGDRTAFTVRETYAGVMSPLVSRSVPDLQPSFEAFVAGLRRDVEAEVPHPHRGEDRR